MPEEKAHKMYYAFVYVFLRADQVTNKPNGMLNPENQTRQKPVQSGKQFGFKM